MTTPSEGRSTYGIETHSIDYIARSERHGKVAEQGPFWFTGNFQFMTVSIGFIGPSMGLSFGWTSLAGTLGILFGTLFMAFHATQGPILGLPQMIQSRAQFGYRGVVVPLIGTLVNYGGLNVVAALLLMSGMHNLFGFNQFAVLGVTAIASVVLAIYGYDWLHLVFKILFWISLPLFTLLTLGITFGAVKHGAVPHAGFNVVDFGVQFAAAASYNIAYAPYVSDYSRYLRRDTPAMNIIAAVFTGASSAAIWLIILGAWLATRLAASDPLVAIGAAGNAMLPGLGTVLALDSALVLLAVIAMDNYSGMLTLVTGADSISAVKPTRMLRAVFVCVITALWMAVALAGGQNAIGALGLVLVIILYLLVPWTSVNLVDFFFIRRGHYAIQELFKPNGLYGAWAWRGLLAYALGWMAIIPFAVLPGMWTGPLAARLGGVDVGWLMGLLVSGGSYYVIARLLPMMGEPAITSSSRAETEMVLIPVSE